MGKRQRYEPGTFSWVELSTPDPRSATGFYRGLLGWESRDDPIPDEAGGGVYTTLLLDGEQVAGLSEQRSEQRDAGIPPNWLSYITVADADATAARAAELGGAVHAGPFDVMEAGRMAVIADPTGAMVSVWQAGESIGATLVNDPGCLTANELSTNDVPRASAFYEALFGWRVERAPDAGGPPYWLIEHAGAAEGQNGGIRELAPEQQGVPPYWMPYFTTASLDAAIDYTQTNGGVVHAGPLTIPAGRIAVIADPQGAVLGLFEGNVDD